MRMWAAAALALVAVPASAGGPSYHPDLRCMVVFSMAQRLETLPVEVRQKASVLGEYYAKRVRAELTPREIQQQIADLSHDQAFLGAMGNDIGHCSDEAKAHPADVEAAARDLDAAQAGQR